jgi:hypothetical protein
MAIRTQASFNYTLTGEAPVILQQRFDYDGSNQCIYKGFANMGEAASDAKWTVYKFTYDVSGNCTLKQTAVDIAWDDRATETFT